MFRSFKFFLFITVLLGSVYGLTVLFSQESKKIMVEKTIHFPIQKVFSQFTNLQNFVQWNDYFSGSKRYYFHFFEPYEGRGSSVCFIDSKDSKNYGEIFIRNEKPNEFLKYHVYKKKDKYPYQIDVKMIPQGQSTRIIWKITTPKSSFLNRILGFVSENYITDNLGQSMKNLSWVLSQKVDKEYQISNIRYDSIFVESQGQKLLLGVYGNADNWKESIFRNIVLNHNKVYNFITKDLSKKEDEFGEYTLVTDLDGIKKKEISYFYGVPVSHKEVFSDNNFTFKTLNAMTQYSIFYQGDYNDRIGSITSLLEKVKKDSLKNGVLKEVFLTFPEENKDVILKISVSVFK